MVGLSDDCAKSLCMLGIGAGAVVIGVGGREVLTGVVEMLSGGSSFLVDMTRDQEDAFKKIHNKVYASIKRENAGWLRELRRGNLAGNPDAGSGLATVQEAIDAMPHELSKISLDAEKAIKTDLDVQSYFSAVIGCLEEKSLFVTDSTAKEVLRKLVVNTHEAAQLDPDIRPLFDKLFQRESLKLQRESLELQRKNAEELSQIRALLGEDKTALAEQVSQEHHIPIRNLVPLFERVGHEMPKVNFDAAVKNAIDALFAKADDPVALLNDPEEITIAIRVARKKLREADFGGAVEHLRNVRAEQAAIREQRASGEARLAREEADILKLAYRFDEAIRAYEIASELDNSNSWDWFHIGDIRISRGNLALAEAAYKNGFKVAQLAGRQRDLSVFHERIGELQRAQGNLEAALASYRSVLLIIEQLSSADPSNAGWQRDLSVSHIKIGDVEFAQGNLDAALASYNSGFSIREQLALSDSGNAQSQRDLSVSYERIGGVQRAQGNLEAALESYNSVLLIIEQLSSSDPGNAGWRRDLSVSLNKIGDVQRVQGNLEEALESYNSGLSIAKQLSESDSGNAEWQRDLSISYDRTGDVQRVQGNLEEALKSYNSGLSIAKQLSESDSDNAEWQRDLSTSYDRIGNVQVARGDLVLAQKSFEASLGIREHLASSDATNAGWQRDLIFSNIKLAQVGDQPVSRLETALEIAANLKSEGRMQPVDYPMIEALENMLAEARSASE